MTIIKPRPRYFNTRMPATICNMATARAKTSRPIRTAEKIVNIAPDSACICARSASGTIPGRNAKKIP